MNTAKLSNSPLLLANYIQGQQGHWLLTQWRTEATTPAHQALLLLPPFAEEMNCVRRHFAALARALTSAGTDVYLMDYYGTGDSEGQFADSSVALWQADCLQWLATLRGYAQLHLLGCRFSAALLLDWLPAIQHQLASQHIHIGKILLWQPLLQMDKFWQQLRRQQQLSGQQAADEVAGYALPVGLQAETQALQTDISRLQSFDVLWLEAQLTGQLSAASQRLLQVCPDIRQRTLTLAPYWLEQEVQDCSPLIDASRHFLTELADVT